MEAKTHKERWYFRPVQWFWGRNLSAIFLCLAAASIFWVLNSLNKEHTTRISYPIRFIYKDSGLVMLSPPPERIEMSVSGYGWNLLKKTYWFNIKPVTLRIDPFKTKHLTSKRLLSVMSEELNGIKVNYLIKDTIWLHFERKMEKELVLTIDTSKLNLESGLAVISPVTMTPDKIRVEGPESIIYRLKDTLEIIIPSGNINKDFNEEVKLFEFSDLVKMSAKKVNVSFSVGVPLPVPMDTIPIIWPDTLLLKGTPMFPDTLNLRI